MRLQNVAKRARARRPLGDMCPAGIALLALAVAGACAPQATSSPAPPPPTRPASTEPAARAVTQELALATFDSAWGRIARVHYDSGFNGVDWQGVREELRPEAAGAATMAELRAVISDMLERLGESHYGLIPGEVSTALETPDRTASGGSRATSGSRRG